MQRNGGAADLVHECLATRLEFFQIRRTEGRVGRSWEKQISYFEITHRPVIWRGQAVDLFRNAQRGLADFICRPDVADDGGIDCVAENYHCVISDLGSVTAAREAARQHDVRIGRADKEAEFFQRFNFFAQSSDRCAQFFFALRRDRLERVFHFRSSQSFFGRREIRIRCGSFL